MEVAWLTSTHSRSTAPGKKELISHILSRAEELVERELAIYRVRERQQQAMAEVSEKKDGYGLSRSYTERFVTMGLMRMMVVMCVRIYHRMQRGQL